MSTMAGRLLAELLPSAVNHKRAHTQSDAWEHMAEVEAMRENRVLAPSLALSPGVTVELRHNGCACSVEIVIHKR